jgi:hypothetical protein
MKQQHQMMQNASFPQLSHFQYGSMPATTTNTMSLHGFY